MRIDNTQIIIKLDLIGILSGMVRVNSCIDEFKMPIPSYLKVKQEIKEDLIYNRLVFKFKGKRDLRLGIPIFELERIE